MTNIDPTRLTAIFRALSATEAQKNQSAEGALEKKKTTSSKSITIETKAKRDKEDLKKALSMQLKKIKKEDPNFSTKAPIIAIKEILLWEFGEDLMNHPDFNFISQMVVDQVNTNKPMEDYLKNLIQIYSTS